MHDAKKKKKKTTVKSLADFFLMLFPHFNKFPFENFRLIRYLHPTDEELMSLAGIQRNPDRKSKGKKNKDRYEFCY